MWGRWQGDDELSVIKNFVFKNQLRFTNTQTYLHIYVCIYKHRTRARIHSKHVARGLFYLTSFLFTCCICLTWNHFGLEKNTLSNNALEHTHTQNTRTRKARWNATKRCKKPLFLLLIFSSAYCCYCCCCYCDDGDRLTELELKAERRLRLRQQATRRALRTTNCGRFRSHTDHR